MALGSFAFAIIPCMESSLVRILALCGIFAFAAIVALAFGRWIADGFDAVFAKWRRLGFVGCVVSVAMVVVATVEAKGEGRCGDIDKCIEGKVFRFWTNEETAKGDFVGQIVDLASNAADMKVNGRYDLINFFPLKVDLTSLQAIWGDSVIYRIKPVNAQNGAFNFCFANVPSDNIRLMQTSELTDSSGKKLSDADLIALPSEGYAFSQAEISRLSSGGEMLIMEAKAANATIELSIEYEGAQVYTYTVPLSISSITNMYRYLNLRWVIGDSSGESSHLSSPWNRPDEECDGRHFVFVHGYNVDLVGSRNWANQMFKRLWWAGSKSMFTAVDWKGDESQKYLPVVGEVSPNYYINVKNAFVTASQATTSINALLGKKIMLAHSLGNMLVSSAAKDHGLSYSKYYMLNAAVPMEAYDENAYNNMMIDGAWSDVPEIMRVSRFSDLFSQTVNDFRLGLSWKGRFAGISNAVNCYSPTEDVLGNPKEIKVFGVSIGEDFGGAWSKQELFKGCALWYGVNTITFSGTEIEGGWGINASYMANPLAYIPLVGFNASYFADYTREDLITKPLFTGMNDDRMQSTNILNFVDAELRAKMLGDAIPAESFAAGANHTRGIKDNHNMQTDMSNGWPKRENDWLHSDIKNVSFYYVHKLFNYILQGDKNENH